jgi:hypothetical protein
METAGDEWVSHVGLLEGTQHPNAQHPRATHNLRGALQARINRKNQGRKEEEESGQKGGEEEKQGYNRKAAWNRRVLGHPGERKGSRRVDKVDVWVVMWMSGEREREIPTNYQNPEKRRSIL